MICGHCKQQDSTIDHVRSCSGAFPATYNSAGAQLLQSVTQRLPVLIPSDEPKPSTSFEPVEEGIYELDGAVYRVKWNKSHTRRYAEQMTGKTGRWVYAKGVIAQLRPEHKVSLDRAKEYGQTTGICMMCGRLLTNPTSVAEGIGPICAGRF